MAYFVIDYTSRYSKAPQTALIAAKNQEEAESVAVNYMAKRLKPADPTKAESSEWDVSQVLRVRPANSY